MLRNPATQVKKSSKQNNKQNEINLKDEVDKKEIEVDFVLQEIKQYVNLYIFIKIGTTTSFKIKISLL